MTDVLDSGEDVTHLTERQLVVRAVNEALAARQAVTSLRASLSLPSLTRVGVIAGAVGGFAVSGLVSGLFYLLHR